MHSTFLDSPLWGFCCLLSTPISGLLHISWNTYRAPTRVPEQPSSCRIPLCRLHALDEKLLSSRAAPLTFYICLNVTTCRGFKLMLFSVFKESRGRHWITAWLGWKGSHSPIPAMGCFLRPSSGCPGLIHGLQAPPALGSCHPAFWVESFFLICNLNLLSFTAKPFPLVLSLSPHVISWNTSLISPHRNTDVQQAMA